MLKDEVDILESAFDGTLLMKEANARIYVTASNVSDLYNISGVYLD